MKTNIFAIIGIFLTTLCFAQTGERGMFTQEGIASWYGGEFNGRPTASGEIFNDTAFTAAHPFLPFGTMLKITNQHNEKSVTVRVNDRGPFVAARIIDLSRSAALQLDMIRTGTAPVKVESLEEVSLPAKAGAVKPAPVATPAAVQPAAVPVAAPAAAPVAPSVLGFPEGAVIMSQTVPPQPIMAAPTMGSVVKEEIAGQGTMAGFSGVVRFQPAIPQGYTGKNYRVQVGSYKESRHAIEAYEKLKNAGLNPAYERYGEYCRVVLPGLKQEELNAVAERLGRAGFREAMLREEI